MDERINSLTLRRDTCEEEIRFVERIFRGIKHALLRNLLHEGQGNISFKVDSLIFISGEKQFKRKRSVSPGFVSSSAHRRIPAICYRAAHTRVCKPVPSARK